MEMSESTINLINTIKSGDVIGMESSFNAAMAEKVSAKLDDMRATVAQNMFKTVEEPTPEATPEAE